MKYDVALFDVVIFRKADTVWDKKLGETAIQGVVDAIIDGYEIYSAIPVASEGCAVIQYILRRKRTK